MQLENGFQCMMIFVYASSGFVQLPKSLLVIQLYNGRFHTELLRGHAKFTILVQQNICLVRSNIPHVYFEQTKPILPSFERLIHSTDEEVLTDACWDLSYLSDGKIDKIKATIEAGVCRRIFELWDFFFLLFLSPLLGNWTTLLLEMM